MADRLTVRGLGKAVDGTYEFDLANLVSVNGSEALTTRERHRIKVATGIRGAEIQEAVAALDAAMMVELVSIILERNGKQPSESRLWDCKFLYSLEGVDVGIDDYRLAVHLEMDLGRAFDTDEDEEEEADSDVPPVLAPPTL